MEALSDLQTLSAEKINDLVDGEDVTLVGNGYARCAPKGITVRMNQGIKAGPADIWVNNLVRRLPSHPKYGIAMRMNAELDGVRLFENYPDKYIGDTFFWDADEYKQAAEEIGYDHPTTGTMAVWWFINKTKCKPYIDGFDFFKGVKVARCHQIEKDEAYVRNMVRTKRLDWLVPDVSEWFADNPTPDEVVILGKGASLDKYDPVEFISAFVIGLNETIECQPCHMGVYIDRRQKHLKVPNDIVLVRPTDVGSQHGGQGYIYDRMRDYDNGHTKATAAMAITMMGMWGVKKITFVGFDAFDGPTEKIKANCVRAITERGNGDYAAINKSIKQALEHTGIEPIWFHRRLSNG